MLKDRNWWYLYCLASSAAAAYYFGFPGLFVVVGLNFLVDVFIIQ